MSLAKCVVFEKQPRWAIALRRTLGTKVRVYEVRSVADCQQQLRECPQSIVLWEGTYENRGRLAGWLAEFARLFPHARHLVVSARKLQPYGRLWREAGAIHAAWSLRQAGQVATIVQRHFARVIEPAQNLDDALWNDLPWPEDGTTSTPAPHNTDGS